MSPAIDLSLTDNEFTPTPPSSTTVPTTTSDPTNDSEAAPFVSLIEQLRRAKAALPGDEHDKVIGSTASSRSPREICDITSGASTEESAEGYGGFGQEVKLIESKRSGVMPDVQGLALTFDAIPERVMSLVSFIYFQAMMGHNIGVRWTGGTGMSGTAGTNREPGTCRPG